MNTGFSSKENACYYKSPPVREEGAKRLRDCLSKTVDLKKLQNNCMTSPLTIATLGHAPPFAQEGL